MALEIESIDPLPIVNFSEPSLDNFGADSLDQALVQAEIARFQTKKGMDWLRLGLERSRPYRKFIINRLQEKNLPTDLFWLIMVESIFNEQAVSRSGASGLWQFMRNSIGDKLIINEWLDERFDFWKSTDAALEKLAYNFEKTGDWFLALAAYNAGLGRIQRIMQNNPGMGYWELVEKELLPSETSYYVPRLLAVSYICNHPGRFGLDIQWQEPVEWVRIPLERPASLKQIETLSGLPPGLLTRANSELRLGITPPGGKYQIKVPQNYADAIKVVISDAEYLVEIKVHTIGPGDTLYGLALKHATTVEMINEFNQGLKAKALKLGKTLIIPIGLNGAKRKL